jgi:prepilin-type processing-associated H-X9-DG protein
LLTIHATKLDHYAINYTVRDKVANEGFRPAPNSRHPGGVNVVYAGAHTAFLTETMDEMVYARSIAWGGGLKTENDAGRATRGTGPPTDGPS